MMDFEQDEALLQDFLTESEELVQRTEQDLVGLETSSDPELLNRIFRAVHTVKGTSSFLNLSHIVELTHTAEDLLNSLRKGEARVTPRVTTALLTCVDHLKSMLADLREKRQGTYDLTAVLRELRTAREAEIDSEPISQQVAESPKRDESSRQSIAAASTMRVDVRKLDFLVNLVGELVLERNRLAQIARDSKAGDSASQDLCSALNQSVSRLSFITDELHSATLGTRMVPLETILRKAPRLVRDLAKSLNKQVQLSMTGIETEIDRSALEHLADPIVHILRNCLDHAIESPEERQKAGKSASALIQIEASQEGEQIVVSITDDGRGIDERRVIAKALEKGLISEDRAASLSRRDALELIFLPGFSTAEKVSNVSGRGVGMDVVRSNLKKINGSVELESTVGSGTTIRLRVPLTMAILQVLLAQVADEVYALPLRSVSEIVRVRGGDIHIAEGREVLVLRDRTIPLLRLARMVGAQPSDNKTALRAVVLSVNDQQVALLVERLIGQESTVIKPLGNLLSECTFAAGATISGDGMVRLVLDPALLFGAEAIEHAMVCA